MSYWRKLFIVVLLALSLPVQSFAAISMKCIAAHTEAGEASAQHMELAEPAHHHEMHGVALADDPQHDHLGKIHHAHSCSTCASCCFGTGLLAAPSVAAPTDATRIAVSSPPPAAAVSFLTSGIERPPRHLLV
ncbi:TPA: hypothetical protein ACU967_005953 [Burkholderia contaminans]|uniref:hypothetical protein n=1 Tax=Burkholderia cepacia complex TaxID=87882 RepID=UPI0009BCB8E4|nr:MULTISPECIES: hypothetical protein [Burkholderia cepacia complex]MBM6430568.1 hypothetical protein [Burkholderia contaminans]MCA7880849.1 hypothetical protein [Burkholderia contaminans]MCB4349247.1 hypothetical protein [Burkholderia vietnamiensis]MDN8025827.1 hypothetical protein [Burkholderia contaminans]PRG04172.1 hypothetical protein C6Q17_28460 [Burkholderia contaminans]